MRLAMSKDLRAAADVLASRRSGSLLSGDDPAVQAFLTALDRCFLHDAKVRRSRDAQRGAR